ncbi:MAG: DUF4230 domain-containing protein [Eubacterium sp.]|nr:DUF4230 domain-containing protein [Eubacterium sp.]
MGNEDNKSVIKLIGLVGALLVVLLFVVIWNVVDEKKRKEERLAATEITTEGNLKEIKSEKKNEKHKYTVDEIESQIKPAGDLIVEEYHYKDAGVYEDYKTFFGARVPLTTDKQVFTYKGTAKVGYDFEKIEYEIDNENKEITVKLPELEILSNEIDHSSFQIVDSKDSIFNSQDFSDFNALEEELINEKNAEVLNDENLKADAERKAKEIIISFLKQNPELSEYNMEITMITGK